jgi:hypothetical protein
VFPRGKRVDEFSLSCLPIHLPLSLCLGYINNYQACPYQTPTSFLFLYIYHDTRGFIYGNHSSSLWFVFCGISFSREALEHPERREIKGRGYFESFAYS